MSGSSSARSRGSKKTTKRTGRNKPKAIDAPFDPRDLRRAREIATTYRLVIERSDEGNYLCSSIEMPLVMGVGETVDEAVRECIELHVTAIASMLERGERPPAAASEGKRDQQVNIRLTADEKYALEGAARRKGFRSVSDFIRTAALGEVG